jgi:hypothetical protein
LQPKGAHVHDQELRELAQEVAYELPGIYAAKGRPNLSEMHHLQPATNTVAAKLAPTWDPAPSLDGHEFGPKLGWVGLGNVDTVFAWPAGTRTFLELKCDRDLSACVWDAVKLSAAVLNGNANAGYMLAGAPTSAWEKPAPGAELFESCRWVTIGPGIRDRYRRWWWNWQEEIVGDRPNRHIPGSVAASFETVPVGRFPFEVAGTPWQLRLARIETVGADWINWTCVCCS